jgi:hypothetical protein
MNETKKIYITVGNRFSNKPIRNKTVFVTGILTEIQAAKKLRKLCADIDNIKPSELYWAIFDNLDDEKPRISSKNYIQGNLVSVHIFMMIGV